MKFEKVLLWIIAFFWMILIYFLSAQVGEDSGNLSKGMSVFLLKILKEVFPNVNLDINSLHYFIRKAAHFFAYFVLGILVLNALRFGEVIEYREILIAIIICVMYAISDEFHQSLVPGRGPAIKDVLIDTSGAFVGVIILYYKVNFFR